MATTTVAVRERPILFSDEMVRALLDGRKTQTRRVMKLPSWSTDDPADVEVDGGGVLTICAATGCLAAIPCPYGEVGDRLYVKESAWMWCERRPNGTTRTGRPKWLFVPLPGAPIHYVADGGGRPITTVVSPVTGNRWGWHLKVARFLPRSAARLSLEITERRAERVQEISEEDIIAEGLATNLREHDAVCALRGGFRALWDSINGSRGFGWDIDPRVWAITFRVLDGEEVARG